MDNPIREVTKAMWTSVVYTAVFAGCDAAVPHLGWLFALGLLLSGFYTSLVKYSKNEEAYGSVLAILILVFALIILLASIETLAWLLVALVIISAVWAILDAIGILNFICDIIDALLH